jgi:hypothetical protein
MAFNDTKLFNGQRYSGMNVGSAHKWVYPNGLWEETKVAPDQWRIRFSSVKCRANPAPEGSGAPLGTAYHWYIMADQTVTKTTKEEYVTEMIGDKYKIGHKRPYWKGFSYTYPGQTSYRRKVIDALKETIRELEEQEGAEITRAILKSAGCQPSEMAKV